MSTYTPCFPPSNPKPDRTHLLSSTSGTSSSDNAPKVSFSARLSRAHLALASVSDHVRRPPSPTSAAIDLNRVGRLRRKFRLAVAVAYRDTSGGKWAHVSEMARLGCTIGRWQGVCSGNKVPHTLCPPSTGGRNEQGVADGPQPEVNPYPRPPIFDLGQIRERVENWKVNVVPAPLSQADSQHPDSSHLRHSVEDADRLLSPLNFPVVKPRKSDIAKAMKRKRKASSGRDYTTSRYFRGDGLADRMSPEAQAVNRNAECVTPAPRSLARRSNAELTPHSRAESLDEDPESVGKLSPTPAPITAPVPENIHQIAEAFLPPSFPSQLQTSTPPPACDRLIKPPVIPRAEGLFLSASLNSPPPFPRSQLDHGSSSQPLRTPVPYTRSRKDIPSPSGSQSPKFKRRLQAAATVAAPEKLRSAPTSSSDSDSPNSSDARRRQRQRRNSEDRLSPARALGPTAPVIDLHLLASQRSRDSMPRHQVRAFALGSSPITPRTASRPKGKKDKGKGKARAMTADLVSPSGRGRAKRSSRALSSPPAPAHLHPHPQTQTPPLSPPVDFTRDAHAFAPAATSTQRLPSHAQGHAQHGSQQREIFGLEARGSGMFRLDRDIDGAAWVRDVPVVEADGDVEADVDVGAAVGVGVGMDMG